MYANTCQTITIQSIFNSTLIFIIGCLSTSMAQEYIYCNNASSCIGDTIINTGSALVYARGYKSLFGPTTFVAVQGNNARVYCNGAFACNAILNIQSNYISCYGSNSCSNISSGTHNLQILSGSDRVIHCVGSNSCEYSNLLGDSQVTNKIYCSADRSCNYAYFEGIQQIYIRGSYAFNGAIFNSSGLNTVSMVFRGYLAGFGATIICYPETQCDIHCYDNGCLMLYVQCAQPCNIIKGSVDTIEPITNVSDLNVSAFNKVYNSVTNEIICNSATNIFDNWQHVTGGNLSFDQEPICCRGASSCANVENIQLNGTETDIITCSGYYSCYGLSFKIININSVVFCTGSYSCYGRNIYAKDVYCLGERSCTVSKIYYAQNVYCGGYRSCHGADIYTNNNNANIYFLGYNSGGAADIYCNGNIDYYLFCGGSQSCTTTTFHCNGTAECVSDFECPKFPTHNPTINPTSMPTNNPSVQPSNNPTNIPTVLTLTPTINPTLTPTNIPTDHPISTTQNNDGEVTDLYSTKYGNNEENKGRNDNSDNLGLIIGVIVGLIIICMILLLVLMWCKKSKNKSKQLKNENVVHVEMPTTHINTDDYKQTRNEIVNEEGNDNEDDDIDDDIVDILNENYGNTRTPKDFEIVDDNKDNDDDDDVVDIVNGNYGNTRTPHDFAIVGEEDVDDIGENIVTPIGIEMNDDNDVLNDINTVTIM